MTPTIREPKFPDMHGAIREATIEIPLRSSVDTRSNPETVAAAYMVAAEMLRSGEWHGGLPTIYGKGRGDNRKSYMSIGLWQCIRKGEESTFFTGKTPITE